MEVITLLSLIISFTAGAVTVYIIYKKKLKIINDNLQSLQNEKDILKNDLEKHNSSLQIASEKLNIIVENNTKLHCGLEERIKDLSNDLKIKEETIIKLNSDLASKNSDLENIGTRLKEHKEELANMNSKFNIEFKNLANEILEEKTKKFTEQNKININDILKPLGEKIKDFEKKVEDTYDKESKQRFSLQEEIKKLAELNIGIQKEASDLTNALKGQSKTRGNWGEMILESILEKSGLTKDREYFVQPSYTDESGKRLQPDVVIHYPGNRHVVVDSKVSLNAFERYSSADAVDEEIKAGRDHVIAVRNHINELASKNYSDIYQLKSLDFVMMFLPVEPAYMLAVQLDPEIWNYAYDRRILLISPTNLIAALKLVASLWRQEYQNKNAQEIARQSGDLYDKFVGLLEDLEEVGKKLKSTDAAFQSSMNKLSTGRGNLIKRVQDIKSLGAKTRKNIPDSLLDDFQKESEE